MSKRAEELWEKHSGRYHNACMERADFMCALHEYGQEVRRRDAEVCRTAYPKRHSYSSENSDIYSAQDAATERCAGAIAKEPLP